MRLLERFLRDWLARRFAGRPSFALERKLPDLERSFRDIPEFGLYLHIPFCRRLYPYCPYNKEIYRPDAAADYARAVTREVDLYSRLIAARPVTSFYIGGGTPTTMLHSGLADILEHVYATLNLQCDVHMESHPTDLTPENLRAIADLGVRHLSMGIESLHDHHLRRLERPYSAAEARAAIERAVAAGFRCLNVDVMFALPGQTLEELEEETTALARLGVDQVAAYPIFTFPQTRWARVYAESGLRPPSLRRRRAMLAVFEQVLYAAGFERTSVWAFTRAGVPKYCSVTVPLYIGLGAGAASYLRDVF